MSDAPKGTPGQSIRPITVEKQPLTPEDLQNIGKMLVSTSHLEDLLSLLIFQLAKLESPMDGYVVLGRLSVSEKIKRADNLVNRYTDDTFKNLFADFKISLSNFFRYRNAFAHGVYQGIDKADGTMVFALTAEDFWDPKRDIDGHISVGILPTDLMADEAEKMVPLVEDWWKLKDWRATRYGQHHEVIPRGQRPRRS